MRRKIKKFDWPTNTRDPFESLKLQLTSTPLLVFPCFKEQIILFTNASQFEVGVVHAQMQDGKERAICYASKTLKISK